MSSKTNRGGQRVKATKKTDKELEQEQYARNKKLVDEFLKSKTSENLEITEGGYAYFWKINSASELSTHIKDTVFDNGEPMDSDTTIYIKYKDGTEAYTGWNGEVVDGNNKPLKHLKRTGIETYIENGGWGTCIYGKVNIVDYNQRYENWGGPDWRAE